MPPAPPPPHQQQPYAPYAPPQPYGYGPGHAQQLEDARKAQKLVSLSRWMVLGGVLAMAGGCGGGIALQVGALALGGGILGALVIVAAAVVGTFGRGMQGRVI